MRYNFSSSRSVIYALCTLINAILVALHSVKSNNTFLGIHQEAL